MIDRTMCTSCGGALEFQVSGSQMLVCQSCRAIMRRYGEKIEDYGKAPVLVETTRRLALNKRGNLLDQSFELVGHAQLEQEGGAVWDEWYAALADGRWAWIAEAQGKLYCTLERSFEDSDVRIPSFDELDVGSTLLLPGADGELCFVEKGMAKVRSAEGEIPWAFKIGEAYRFADLSGPDGAFATIDYAKDEPRLFLGVKLHYEDLAGLSEHVAEPPHLRQPLSSPCPNCKAQNLIHLPEQTVRVACTKCSALLDFKNEELRDAGGGGKKGKSKKAKGTSSRKSKLILPIGSVGRFPEGELTIVGYLQRSIRFEGVNYYWDEYLLHERDAGFRWLVNSDDHWSYVTPVPTGEVQSVFRTATYRNQSFQRFQNGKATVRAVQGEFYWKVSTGEEVSTTDYVAPPLMLSQESTMGKGGVSEVNWSLGKYLTPAEVENSFGIKNLKRPSTIAPNQPYPHRDVYRYWFLLFCMTLVIGLILQGRAGNHHVLTQSFTIASGRSNQFFDTKQFNVNGNQNVSITASGGTPSKWVIVNGDVTSTTTNKVHRFGLTLGGADRAQTVYVSSLPAGEYTMRVNLERNDPASNATVKVEVRQDRPHTSTLVWTLVLLSIVPVLVGFHHVSFISRRWKDST